MSEQVSGGLTADEQAYFDSKGEKEIPAEPSTPETQEAQPEGEAPSVEEAPAEGEQPPAEGEGEGQRRPVKTVPHQALHEAREQLRREKEERAQERAEANRREALFNERLALLFGNGQQQQEPQQPAGPPDPNQNPIEAVEYAIAKQRELEEAIRQRDHQEKERTARSHVEQFKAADEHHARQAIPDYDQAKEYLGRMVAQQLVIQSGGRATQAQINAALQAEEERITVNAIMQQERPAKRFYELAVASGWKPQGQQQQADPAQRIEDLAKGQGANRSLSSAGGSGPAGGEMTAQRLIAMSDAEFRAYKAKNEKTVRRLMGG